MSILILSKYPAKAVEYNEWLKDLNENLIVFTVKQFSEDYKGYSLVKGFEKYITNDLVELEAAKLYKSEKFRTIIALDEVDIIRAGSLRDHLKLPGQTLASARAFRDKVIMKTLIKKNNIPCPEFKKIVSPLDLQEFINENGFPIVVKPIDGMGAKDTYIFKSYDDILAVKHLNLNNMMVEKYVDGKMYTIDGLVINGDVAFCSATEYINTCIGYRDHKDTGYLMIDKSHPLYTRLFNFNKEILSALPTPLNTAFHCEVFHTKDDELVFCEIASRGGGGKIVEAIKLSYGIDIEEKITQLNCGLNIGNLENLTPKKLVGCYIIPKKIGYLKKMVDDIPFDWAINFNKFEQSGTKIEEEPINVLDGLGTVLFEGINFTQLQERFSILSKFMNDNIIWDNL